MYVHTYVVVYKSSIEYNVYNIQYVLHVFFNFIFYVLTVLDVFVTVQAFSLLVASVSYFSGFSCCRALALGPTGFSSCGPRAQYLQLLGSRTQAQ